MFGLSWVHVHWVIQMFSTLHMSMNDQCANAHMYFGISLTKRGRPDVPHGTIWGSMGTFFFNHLLQRRRVENVSRKIGVRKEALVLKVNIARPF